MVASANPHYGDFFAGPAVVPVPGARKSLRGKDFFQPRLRPASGDLIHLYSVTALTDDAGAVVERYTYDAYGKRYVRDDAGALKSDQTGLQAYGFTGRRLDGESGLWYFRARYFDDQLGRFIGRDPVGYVDGTSLYNEYFVPDGLDPVGLYNMWDSVVKINWNYGYGGPGYVVNWKETWYMYFKMNISTTKTGGQYKVVQNGGAFKMTVLKGRFTHTQFGGLREETEAEEWSDEMPHYTQFDTRHNHIIAVPNVQMCGDKDHLGLYVVTRGYGRSLIKKGVKPGEGESEIEITSPIPHVPLSVSYSTKSGVGLGVDSPVQIKTNDIRRKLKLSEFDEAAYSYAFVICPCKDGDPDKWYAKEVQGGHNNYTFTTGRFGSFYMDYKKNKDDTIDVW